MKKMKKNFLNQISKIFVSTIFIASVALPSLRIDVLAALKPTEKYKLNSNISYTFKDVNIDGYFDTLIIEGDGPIPSFRTSGDDAAPWRTERHNIVDIIIEDGVKSIGDNAFYQFDYLKEVEIPDTVKYIGEGAFFKCARLETITIPYGVDVIEPSTFSGCYELESITIPKNVTEIQNGAFTYCLKLDKIRFEGNNLELIDAAAFAGCAFEEIEIPEGVENIKENAFNGCSKLKEVTIPKSVKKIGVKAFENCPDIEEVNFDCRTSLEFDEEWGFDEEFFILKHNFRNGVCTICSKKEKEESDDTEYVDWDEIIENTEFTFGTTTYNVKMPSKDTTVPYDVFDVLKDKNTLLNIKVDDTFSWTIKGKEIETPKKLNLGVKIADKTIPLSVMDKYTKDYNYKEIELSGKGEFGLKAELTIDVGTINNENKVDLYYYDPYDADSLEFIATSKVENGKVTLPFTHASKYVLDIYDKDDEKDDDDDDSFGFDDFAAGENIVVTEIIL